MYKRSVTHIPAVYELNNRPIKYKLDSLEQKRIPPAPVPTPAPKKAVKPTAIEVSPSPAAKADLARCAHVFIASCRGCKGENVKPMNGKFGYYFACNVCATNTPIPKSCPSCQSKNARSHKKKSKYFAVLAIRKQIYVYNLALGP